MSIQKQVGLKFKLNDPEFPKRNYKTYDRLKPAYSTIGVQSLIEENGFQEYTHFILGQIISKLVATTVKTKELDYLQIVYLFDTKLYVIDDDSHITILLPEEY